MSRVLLVTQFTRSYGEFRRPWVRALYRRYVERYRRRAAAVAARLAREGELTLLTSRELVDAAALPAGVRVRYFDEETYKVDSDELSVRNRELAAACWGERGAAPDLEYRGVWLPDLLTLARGIVFRMEITEPLGIVERVFDEVKPERLVVLTGASIPERLARGIARSRGVPGEAAAAAAPAARLYARAQRALGAREERLRVRAFLEFPRRPAPTPSPARGPRVLFVTCRPRHHLVVDPLAEALRAAGVETHVLAMPNPEPELGRRLDALRDAGTPAGFLTDFLPPADARELARRHRPAFDAHWRRFAAASGDPDRATGDPAGVAGLARPLFRDSVRQSLVAALLNQEAAHRALDAIRPTALVLTSNRRLAERALALAAGARGIPRLIFSNALVLGRDRYEFFDVADRVLLAGPHLKERLESQQGVDPRLISVVGDPRSNAARLVPPAELRRAVYRDFDLDPARPLLILVSKYASFLFSVEEKEALFRTTFEALRGLPGAQLVVKVHPNEDVGVLRAQVREWGGPDAALTQDYDIHRLFGAADAAVMVTSMAGIEAMAMGCPVVAVQAAGKDYEGQYMPPYVSAGAVERVAMGNPAGLAAALARVLRDGAARAALIERGARFAADYVHPVDGALAARLLRVAEDVRAELGAARRRPR
ncbi:MAG TPA: hypothetical protein VFG27_00140 [Pseudomonadales bacterium]|nr:hypothetical protein [Pseudomonadales bacterium]